MEFLTTDFQISDGKGGILEFKANKERRGSGMSNELDFGEGLIPATSLEMLAEEYELDQVVLNDSSNIEGMKMDFEATSQDEVDTESAVLADLRR